MRALIFGVSGQDGSLLSRNLLQKGYQVYGTSRDAEVSTFKSLETIGIRQNVTVVSASISDFRSVFQTISTIRPDEIYNLAGQTSVGLSYNQPVETLESITIGTMNVLEAIRLSGLDTRFYNASSSECFGDTNGRAATEETQFRPKSPYAVAKAAAFWEVSSYRESYGLYACSGILFNHESILRPSRFVTRKIAIAAARIAAGSMEPLLLGDIDIRRDWGWAPEYVEAMWAMLQQETPQDFVIATGIPSGLDDFVAAAFSSLGLDWRQHVKQDRDLFRPSDIRSGFGCADKAAQKLGWVAATHMKAIAEKMTKAEVARLNQCSLQEFIF